MSPAVSVLIANYNGGELVRDALLSASRQTLKDIEILFVDDGSTDDSRSIAMDMARGDDRIRVIALGRNSGPAAARNAGLAAARGRWLAILDSDDLMHPGRLSGLVAEITRSQATICADDLLVFQDGAPAKAFLCEPEKTRRWITTDEFVFSNQIFSSIPALGYLKPLFDMEFVRAHALAYDPALRIGEDYDFVLRQLLLGAKYRLVSSLGYFYRKHPVSTSHRISTAELDRLLEVDSERKKSIDASDHSLAEAWTKRRRSLERARAFTILVSALKAGDWSAAAKIAALHPSALSLLRLPIMARAGRLLPRPAARRSLASGKRVCLISRQRIIGNTNGSSVYILSLCRALRDRGYRISLISPSPATFGRWPFLRFRPEMDVFDEVFIRGAWRIGRRLFLAKDPRVLLAASLTLVERLFGRLGIVPRGWVKPAPYAMAVPWSRKDEIFIAEHAPRPSHAVIADYAFLTPGIPYALTPRAPSLVVMHDLFSSRKSQFERLKSADSVGTLDEESEISLLGRADAVVAIQEKEAGFVAGRLPETRVILAPMAAATSARAQPGDAKTVLFVGSNTAPNVVGLQWYLESVWPAVRREVPDSHLIVAGSVCQGISSRPAGVQFLGLVADLAPLYQGAGVVISPLLAGSGLKIKLIEALGHGKAVVATSATVEGVEEVVKPAVAVADDADAFAGAIAELLTDHALRDRKCQEALTIAKRSFSAEACYADLLDFIEQRHDRTQH